MAFLTHCLEAKLRLKVNRTKSAVARPWERKFLGYTVTSHRSPRLKPAPSSVKRAKDRIREITHKGRGRNILKVIEEINLFTRGWIGYCSLEPPCTVPYARWCGGTGRATFPPTRFNLLLRGHLNGISSYSRLVPARY